MRSIFGAVIGSVIGLRSGTATASPVSSVHERSLLRRLLYPLLSISLSLLLILTPISRLQAMTLSDITVNSAIGERFYSIIKLSDARKVSTDQILVTLAPRSVYQRMGVDWEYFHTGLIFDVLKDEDRGIYLRIVSKDVLFEPYLDFVISVRWPTGFISKQYTVLLDMPVQQPVQQEQVQQKPAQQIEPVRQPSFSEPVAVSDTQGSIIREPAPAIPPVEELVEEPIDEFIEEAAAKAITEVAAETVATTTPAIATPAIATPVKVAPVEVTPVKAAPPVPEITPEREEATSQELTAQVVESEPKNSQQDTADSASLKTEKLVAEAEIAIEESVADLSRETPVAETPEADFSLASEADLQPKLEPKPLPDVLQNELEVADASSEPAGNLPDAQWQALSKPGDTLWAIARRIQAESGGRIIDIVHALFENNKSAFIRNDADRLRVNASLNVTIAQIKAATPASRRSTALSTIKTLANSTSTESDTTAPSSSASEINRNNDGVLSLVTQDEVLEDASDLTKSLSNELDEKRVAVDEQLNSGISKAVSIEERMANMLSQYQVLSEKTEQLKELEETLNRNIAEKAQVDLGLAGDLPIQADPLSQSPSEAEERSLMWWLQLLVFVLLLIALIFVVFSLLKARRLQRRSAWVEGNWDNSLFDADNPFSDEELTEIVKLKGEASLVEQLDGHADEILFDQSAEGSVELQASLYIAYERYSEAEELLHTALDQQPNNIALKSQLLEVYSALGKTDAFEMLAAQLSDESDDQINHKIDALRLEA